MSLVSRKGVLAIAAVIDVALNASSRPVSAKALAAATGYRFATSSRSCKLWYGTASSKESEARMAAMSSPASEHAFRLTTFYAQRRPPSRSLSRIPRWSTTSYGQRLPRRSGRFLSLWDASTLTT